MSIKKEAIGIIRDLLGTLNFYEAGAYQQIMSGLSNIKDTGELIKQAQWVFVHNIAQIVEDPKRTYLKERFDNWEATSRTTQLRLKELQDAYVVKTTGKLSLAVKELTEKNQRLEKKVDTLTTDVQHALKLIEKLNSERQNAVLIEKKEEKKSAKRFGLF